MQAFEFDKKLINSYEQFSRSFSSIRAEDLKKEIDDIYDNGRFWPDALLSLNPRFMSGPTVDELVNSGDLDEGTGRVFRFGEMPLRFHRHQAEAIAQAKQDKSFVVTTGTGSGKSLCFFVPVVDAVIRARRAGKPRRTTAIIVYPMNALANSQMKEIDKFIANSGLPEGLKPVVKRYTGQESHEERQRIADDPPDILLTNYMMAELLLTRQDDLDSKVISNAVGLDFIILDELHTYRGRQGADVAVLVRRLRNRCSPDRAPICIGTSATMASEGSDDSRALAVAKVASRLFGTDIGPDAVIDESLQRATDDSLTTQHVIGHLKEVITQPLPDVLDDTTLERHPLSVWVELELGLDDGRELRRKKPIPFEEAVKKLSDASGIELHGCRDYLEKFLTRVSFPERERGGTKDSAFLAFKLHRFISGAGDLFTTLTAHPRRILLEGQLEDPDTPGNRLYPTRFCRSCGQEYHVVTKIDDSGETRFLPRSVDDTPLDDEDDDVAGYLCPINPDDIDFQFNGELDSYPESWREEHNGIERLRSYRKKRAPISYVVGADGRLGSEGRDFWFIPGKFAFCLCCHEEHVAGRRERNKLAGLSGEGRSSATTLLVSSALEWMNKPDSVVPDKKRKLLGFTDNRQDAALQSGHFNDFLFVSLLRGAILRAVINSGAEGLAEDEFGLQVVKALKFTSATKETRHHWLLDPDAGAVIREDAQRALAKVLAHRVWTDLRRGWRYTNPSLSVLNLIDIEFLALDEIAEDKERFSTIHPALGDLETEQRKTILKLLLSAMLEGLAVQTESLDLTILDGIAQKSRTLLQTPWAIDQKENPQARSALVLRGGNKNTVKLREEQTLLRAGVNSRIAKLVNKKSVLGVKLIKDEYYDFMEGILAFLGQEGLLIPVELDRELTGWRISPSAIRLIPGPALTDETTRGNRYFHDLYCTIANDLKDGSSSYWGLEGREHTAQVSQKQREWREWRFRFEPDDIQNLAKSEYRTEIRAMGESDRKLPVMFCSPTMELGVDISALNAVYLRNVPPTPANYAQRAGRAGRSGQAAVVVTYCASGSPHDQYFFERRNDMVAGVVRPPELDITNEELVRSHLHAVWLAEAKLALSPDIPEILDLHSDNFALKEEVLSVTSQPALVSKAIGPMTDVLRQILDSEDGKSLVWMDDPDEFVLDTATNAPKEFDRAFDRWRELYRSAKNQLAQANKRSEITGLSGADRRKIKAAQMQAQDQLAILEQGKASNGSDFYSYRYLATESFLPGYNFPRLPLYAFVPGEGKTGSFLSRARFLAISEFGPRSLIYHEGRAYRVMKAKLPPEVRQGDGSELATNDIYICSNCGASHEGEVERCHGCNNHMASEVPVKRTLRIDNVEAAPTERITANDEERVRQGFDIQTVFSWPKKDGQLQVTTAQFKCGDTSILALQYANSAEISRINKGLKRRKDQTVFGFHIDPRSGYWAKSDEEDSDTDVPPDVVKPVRIVPIVRDRKNALLFRFEKPEQYEPETIATVQHALLRGIEVVFQLEEGEILGEPLPAKDNRRAILAYEATEGGAGVLRRMIDDAAAINEVASNALSLMHFENVNAAISAGDASLLREQKDGSCVRGCYRCLLSYFNQPDHELIDRSSPEVAQLLIDLARGKISLGPKQPSEAEVSRWPEVFSVAGIPPIDAKSAYFGDLEFEFVWRTFAVAATTKELTADIVADAANKGWVVVELSSDCSVGLPDQFTKYFEA